MFVCLHVVSSCTLLSFTVCFIVYLILLCWVVIHYCQFVTLYENIYFALV
jgi:hypothetical protein